MEIRRTDERFQKKEENEADEEEGRYTYEGQRGRQRGRQRDRQPQRQPEQILNEDQFADIDTLSLEEYEEHRELIQNISREVGDTYESVFRQVQKRLLPLIDMKQDLFGSRYQDVLTQLIDQLIVFYLQLAHRQIVIGQAVLKNLRSKIEEGGPGTGETGDQKEAEEGGKSE